MWSNYLVSKTLHITARQYGEPAPPQRGPSVKFRSRLLGIGIARSQNAAVAVTRRSTGHPVYAGLVSASWRTRKLSRRTPREHSEQRGCKDYNCRQMSALPNVA
jgi:hypothetical protein